MGRHRSAMLACSAGNAGLAIELGLLVGSSTLSRYNEPNEKGPRWDPFSFVWRARRDYRCRCAAPLSRPTASASARTALVCREFEPLSMQRAKRKRGPDGTPFSFDWRARRDGRHRCAMLAGSAGTPASRSNSLLLVGSSNLSGDIGQTKKGPVGTLFHLIGAPRRMNLGNGNLP